MMPRKAVSVSFDKEHIILCEGPDDKNFIEAFLRNAVFPDDADLAASHVDVVSCGGKSEIGAYISFVNNSSVTRKLKSLLVTRDADDDPQSAEDSIAGALSRANFAVPAGPMSWTKGTPKVGYIIFPAVDGSSRAGALEDLCFSLLKDGTLLGKSRSFIADVEHDNGTALKHHDKNILHAYFSATDRFVGKKIGEAANAGAFAWDSGVLKDLCRFIRAGIK